MISQKPSSDSAVDCGDGTRCVAPRQSHRSDERTFVGWAHQRGIALRFIEPEEPDQNACINRSNRTCRSEVLKTRVFESIEEVQQLSDDSMIEYKEL